MTGQDANSRMGIDSRSEEADTTAFERDLDPERAADRELDLETDVWIQALLAAEGPAQARLRAGELLGRGILRLRLYRGWSQKDLERASGVSQSTICRLEMGRGASVGSSRICSILGALNADDVVILPRLSTVPPTALELMLRGDPWKRALAEAERRVNRRRSA